MENSTVDIKAILKTIDVEGSFNSLTYATNTNIDHELVKGALNSLLLKNYVTLEVKVQDSWVLTEEGTKALTNGTIEYRIW
jgi:PheRS DNA binding domain 1